jgi:hypothetical protein
MIGECLAAVLTTVGVEIGRPSVGDFCNFLSGQFVGKIRHFVTKVSGGLRSVVAVKVHGVLVYVGERQTEVAEFCKFWNTYLFSRMERAPHWAGLCGNQISRQNIALPGQAR